MFLRQCIFLFSTGLLLYLYVEHGACEVDDGSHAIIQSLIDVPRVRRENLIGTCRPTGKVDIEYQQKLCTTTLSRTTSVAYNAGSWWWSTVKYKTKTKYYIDKTCCKDYFLTEGSPPCKPMCNGSSGTYSCNLKEGHVVLKNGVINCSGGGCVAPNKCAKCNDGYYADNVNGLCRACTAIPHCNHPRCTDAHDSYCVFCEQEVLEQKGYKAYSHTIDNKTCTRMCSWQNGSRCYPGTCRGNMVHDQDCECADGFGGNNCATYNETFRSKLEIYLNEVILTGTNGPALISTESKVWTNQLDFSRITVTVKTSVPDVPAPNITYQSYLDKNRTKVGIDNVVITATLSRGTNKKQWTEMKYCRFSSDCNIESINKSFANAKWKYILQDSTPAHLDLISVTAKMTTGGIVHYYDRDYMYRNNISTPRNYSVKGMTVSKTTEIQFDRHKPKHCLEDSSPCSKETIYLSDFNENFSIPVHWDGWSDEDSGIHEYHIDVYKLKANDSLLMPMPADEIEFSTITTEMSSSIKVKSPGPHFVEIAAFDKAGNFKSSRRIFMYDDESVVDLIGDRCTVTTANDPEYALINKASDKIVVEWSGRFMNKRHHDMLWLNEVDRISEIDSELDDTYARSTRNFSAIHNINGTVHCMVGYNVSFGNALPVTRKPFVDVPRHLFDQERMIIHEDLVDGKRLTFMVRAYDVMGKYAEDNTTVDIDLSPPVIQNLWLTKGDILNISVHSVVELNKLTIEWEAFDVHSGLFEISWRIFDNYTEADIDHGSSHEQPQGETETLEECQNKYKDHARGPNCYCTPFHGCFHKHYQIKPRVLQNGSDGLVHDKQTGLHESDYFIEVKANNTAQLKTIITRKITIDTSPPHEGMVHDGLKGQPEVDFQQSLSLNAHWDGFFDKESGVWFYMYGFSDSCLPSTEFDITEEQDISMSQLRKSYSTSAHFTAPSDGTYYVTVAAYNHAYDHSDPVCSDGVTVENVPAKVDEVVVKGAVTKGGLIKDENSRVWVQYKSRVLEEIANPSAVCINKATPLSTDSIKLFPVRRKYDGKQSTIKSSDVCNFLNGVYPHLLAFITSDTNLELSWNVTGSSSVNDFEIGLSSDGSFPDKMSFITSRQHKHVKIFNPNIWDGGEFFLIIRTVTRSEILQDTVVGPFAVDTTKPEFSGTIDVLLEKSSDMNHMIVEWSKGAFADHGDPAPLTFEIAIGSKPFEHDVMNFQRLTSGGSCKVPVTCTAINTERLNWHLHGYHRYYFTVKASNTIGLFTLASSDVYIHDVILPTTGVVYDVNVHSNFLLQDIDDIDFQTEKDTLSVRWSGFWHPHADVSYLVCIKQTNTTLPVVCDSTLTTEHTFTELNLQPFQTYDHVVTAITEAGNVSVTSDGVTIFQEGRDLEGVAVFDGLSCDNRQIDDTINVNTSYHSEDKRLPCVPEVEYQSALNELHVYWEIDDSFRQFTPDVYWALQLKAPVTDFWETIQSYENVKTTSHIKATGLSLMAGRKYRIALKFCAVQFCFNPVSSNGVTILANPPVFGEISVDYHRDLNTIKVEIDMFFDPDIEDADEARAAMDHYEWTFTDDDHHGRLVKTWENTKITSETQTNKASFEISVDDKITFTKCWRLSLRGYNKAGLSSVVSTEIRNCSDINQVKPHVVLDAIGVPVYSSDNSISHEGQPIHLTENNNWPDKDRDYTPYNNIISAVWPSLRYPKYTYVVLEVKVEDATVFYETEGLGLVNPCLHPDSIQCGTTDREFINVHFSNNELQHGARYMVCIHADAASVQYEKWTLDLAEMADCSDGITVDLTPPTPAEVWIGQNVRDIYQSSTSCLSVNWKSFVDVEEEGQSAHVSGVTHYKVAVGTSHGGVDIAEFTDVGLTNHHMFHGLHLQDGHSYFATVDATDFTGQTSRSWSRSIKVDSSPPQLTGQSIQLSSRYITDTTAVSACWESVFVDNESGISYFEWSVGSQRGYDDIMTYTRTTMVCGQSDSSLDLSLVEGHAYFVSVKAFNHAGHYTLAVSWAFAVDASPPIEGQMFDGPRPLDGTYLDVDYSDSTSVVAAHWTEFYEPHGALKEYHVQVGSCVECDDILPHQPIGLTTEIIMTSLKLSEGQRYYVTVTGCNIADMCTVTSSDGVVVDKSPPNPGKVLDGVDGRDIQYQASRIYLGALWFGFNDAQSGISHFVWRAGTSPGADDVLSPISVIRAQKAFIVDIQEDTGRQLPIGRNVYVTVRAYNRAGLFSESTSNGFMVDISAPVFLKNLAHNRIGSVVVNTSVLPSVLSVEWQVADNESFIDEQYLSIVSHIGGDVNTTSIKVDGIVRDYTFSDLDLHDGSIYCVTLVSCNGAKTCSETQLKNILVDSSSPTPGMFAINTDHAVALEREPETWMTWKALYLKLAWLGFEDVHSGIDRYLINVGTIYMGNDLNEKASEPYVIHHVDVGNQTAEGIIQVQKIWTKSMAAQRFIFVSIWAINGVGLPSPIIHHQFELVDGDDLELVRRCDAHTCLGHCVCAPHGEPCHSDTFCSDITNDVSLDVNIEDILDLTFDPDSPVVSFSPTRTLAAARWSHKANTDKSPLWYEWSIGESLYDTPKGVFDLTTERVWHDAGQNTSWICSLQRGHYLREKTPYSFFLRAWFDQNTFAVYKSSGVTVYSTQPTPRKIQGKAVKELASGSDKDVDFTTVDMPLFVDWTYRYINTDDSLLQYHLYISTHPGGHDVKCVAMSVPPTHTRYNISGIKLLKDTRYYSVVQVYNKAGYHRTEWSDGFYLDNKPPVAGIVHDGEVFKDIHALNTSRRVPSFWYGFTDTDSGIKYYNVCMSTHEGRHCNVHRELNVGLDTHAELFPKDKIADGTVLRSEVQAIDFVGFKSSWVKSNGVTIDSSSPVRSNNYKFGGNILTNPSFELQPSEQQLEDIKEYKTCIQEQVHGWKTDEGSCFMVINAGRSHVTADGLQYVILFGAMSQDITNLTAGTQYRLTFFTSHVPSDKTRLSNSEGFVEIDKEKHAFFLRKPSLSKDEGHVDLTLSWHKHTYIFLASSGSTRLTISTVGPTSHVALDLVTVQEKELGEKSNIAEQRGHIQAHTVFIHDWSSIHAEWNFLEDDSEIEEYLWAIGTVEGGTQLQPFTSVGKRTFAFTSSLHLVHDTTVYVTVIAVNAALLRTVSYSDPILIDLTPPDFRGIHDGIVPGKDINYQKDYSVSVNWDVIDEESSIEICEWAIDTGAADIRIKNFSTVPRDIFYASDEVLPGNIVDGMIYVTVRCTNKAGLTSHVTSDGVRIITTSPSIGNVLLEVLGTSLTQYPAMDGYHGDNNTVMLRWTGFGTLSEINNYVVSVDGNGVHEEEVVPASNSGFSYAGFKNLRLADGSYSMSVIATNEVDMFSQKKSIEFIILTEIPSVTGTSIATTWNKASHELKMVWEGVFSASCPLYYEVTVSWADGGDGDIVQWEETLDTALDISLNVDEIPQPGINVRVSVRAITPAGQFAFTQNEFFVET